MEHYGVPHPMRDGDVKRRAVTASYSSLSSKPYSKMANSFFMKLLEILNLSADYDVLFGKTEFVLFETEIFKFDFTILHEGKPKIIIDFHGRMFHPKNGYIPNGNPFHIDILKQEQRDHARSVAAGEICPYLVVWEEDIRKDYKDVLQKTSGQISTMIVGGN